MYLFVFDDGIVGYTQNKPTEIDIESLDEGITAIIDVSAQNNPTELWGDGSIHPVEELFLVDNGDGPYHTPDAPEEEEEE